MELYDVAIIGSGPAGLTAGIYAGRARLKTLIIEKQQAGGQIVQTEEVENYPGALEGDTGPAIIDRMVAQTKKFGVEKVSDEITEVQLVGKTKILKAKGGEYRAKSVIIATGAEPRFLGCPGEKEFIGKGVSYCATCDGAFFEGLDIFVIGGGDTAVEEAMFLTKFGRKVYVVHRRDELRAAKSIQEKAFKNEKVEFIWDSVVEEIKGDGLVNEIVLKNKKTGKLTNYKAEDGMLGVFIFVGYTPFTKLFEGKLDLERSYIKTDENMKTKIPGVFAAGDVRVKDLRQVVTATADGAIAAVQAEKYLEDLE
ncbi:MAG: thioredoxin-disulfide reductase [Tissierellales bacterium]|jgi:thioredoxin reductase (NADPH)|nr:thioredoxin-disulfide reductase [Tissierellales bacterium]